MSERISVTFDRFTLDRYDLFLRCKQLPESDLEYDWERDAYTLSTPARFAAMLGPSISTAPRGQWIGIARHLFDFQRFVLEKALEAKRYAAWLDTGLGKTILFLEYANQLASEHGKVLILSPANIIPQTIETAGPPPRGFYPTPLAIRHLTSREALIEWLTADERGIAIASYHCFVAGRIPELRNLNGLVLDESSILKSGGGVIKWNLLHSTKGIEYKLSCTATPAPNDVMEYASQARFLEMFRSGEEVMWSFFSKDRVGNWVVKPHARAAFYKWLASWSIYMRDPSHFGFGDILSTLPAPEVIEYRLEMTDEQLAEMRKLQVEGGMGLFNHQRTGVQQRSKLSQLAKGFLYGADKNARRVASAKPAMVAALAKRDVAEGRPCLIWTVFDEEAAILEEQFEGAQFRVAAVHGATSEKARLERIEAFRAGDVDVLVTKAQLLGHGMNFQHCRSMVFSGFDDSFERHYQAVRRCVRFGQTEVVRVHQPTVPELEGLIFDNLKSKEASFLHDVEQQEGYYREAMARGVRV